LTAPSLQEGACRSIAYSLPSAIRTVTVDARRSR